MPPPRRKKPLSLRIRQWIHRLRTWRSPLNLRGSLTRLRAFEKHPLWALLRLFVPFPSWKFPVSDTVPAMEMIGNEELLLLRHDNMIDLESIPIWRVRDTPLRCVYRMYEAMASGVYEVLGTETEYFWYQKGWSLQSISDPRDDDSVRYAMIACLVEELVVAFNWRLSLGMRRNRKHIIRKTEDDPWPPYTPLVGPTWTDSVPALAVADLDGLPERYISKEGKLVLEEGGLNKIFARRNMITNVGWLYTI
ncbi:hypothetical protein BO94DRAFT_383818 [Aspergillus sclerotioniger CBS 115572]|uniref:Uncharacterized protein n=1 Tax=Aspergillus sclerotioniger CBS 115572 TaxID=1450535 RepID=A0A317X2S6_9EURO|nr:hypothetical protein BO94DRAFT_383818 [Aspergillus sclerotioniger CBS 115572]PWY91922.1 hypothetical protein BO94DRAFT_383818 [Aspergillus sclerotioniger CBS 115572]